MKITDGKFYLGHFWFVNLCVLDPLPPCLRACLLCRVCVEAHALSGLVCGYYVGGFPRSNRCSSLEAVLLGPRIAEPCTAKLLWVEPKLNLHPAPVSRGGVGMPGKHQMGSCECVQCIGVPRLSWAPMFGPFQGFKEP